MIALPGLVTTILRTLGSALGHKAVARPSVSCIATMLLSVALAACGRSEPPSPADAFRNDPVAMQRGRLLFNGTCGGYCHGMSPGPRDAPYLFDCTWLHGGSDQDLFRVIAEGVPNTRMVPFGASLPEGDDDIWRLVAYITSQTPKSC